MYFNARGGKVSRAQWKEMLTAMKNRQEIIAAGLTRRDLLKMGLLTSAGMLVAKSGLSARVPDRCFFNCNQCASPATTPWVQPLPIMPIKQRVTSALNPAPTIAPNNTGGEGRTSDHVAAASGADNLGFRRDQPGANLCVAVRVGQSGAQCESTAHEQWRVWQQRGDNAPAQWPYPVRKRRLSMRFFP